MNLVVNVDTSYLGFQPLVSRIGNDCFAFPLVGLIDFVQSAVWQLDITAIIQSKQLAHSMQSVWIDTGKVPLGSTDIQLASGQVITVAPQTQGFYPLLITNSTYVFTITNGSCLGVPGVMIAPMTLIFTNVPFVASQWNTQQNGGGGLSGGLGIGPLGEHSAGN